MSESLVFESERLIAILNEGITLDALFKRVPRAIPPFTKIGKNDEVQIALLFWAIHGEKRITLKKGRMALSLFRSLVMSDKWKPWILLSKFSIKHLCTSG